ncbi:MAG: bifunctional phosphoribosylaminoimidazolecarboxamide formyltransferase/IMP cyclohydrolase [Actinomycetaceae bacterium]|nr:bifunctional phosphoribosylaminoimidazolecarboxamide formyltransferase/IMP cyclohydrolase [Actinomycetaceae bacterium]
MSVRLDNLEAIDIRPIRRALISVYDKTGLIDCATALHEAGVEIVSTGSTATHIHDAGIPVTPVEKVTGFPEVLEGRVKTLHPHIHAGILADQRKADHREQLEGLGVAAFDAVICNLYPFEETVASGASFDACVEQIDIGGPSMVRAAAKNHPSVAVIVDPAQYGDLIKAAQGEGYSLEQRRHLAARAFATTAHYDSQIDAWLATQLAGGDAQNTPDGGADIPTTEWAPVFERSADLRYGENPHQSAAVYTSHKTTAPADNATPTAPGIAHAIQLSGKPMSYNNYVDGDAALRAAYDHARPCVAIIKHANPCGIAVGDTVAQAHQRAHACDPVSAFGGVIAVNRPVSCELAEQILPIFTEVVIAPGYDEGAAEILAGKKNLRVLIVTPPTRGDNEFKQISGGLLIQQRDDITADGDSPENWTLAAGPAADEATLADLEFAWRAVRAVRSNAILLAKDGASIGVGMGQVNRVDSCKLAVERANTLGTRSTGDAAQAPAGAAGIDSAGGARAEDLVADAPPQRSLGAVAASDAFFPFADGLQVLIDAGVKAVIQPGGSVRDAESIAAAEAAGITMYFTGVRHFAH